ncbi:MAG TPA: CBS domain-containing protein [Polyangiaceae bacterium]
MRIGEICSRTVSSVGPSTSLLGAARRMRDDHVGDLVVVDERGGRPVPIGVLTDRDIVVGVLAKDADHLRSLDVGDVIEGPLVTATEDEDLWPVLRRMRSFGVRRVPVVDAEGVLVGLLSADDIIPALGDELAELAALVSRQARREPGRRP